MKFLNTKMSVKSNIKSKKTLILSECVLAYLDPSSVKRLKIETAKYFTNLVWVDYEMFNKNDAFGKVMVRNFEVD